jgi:hypothetical protein
MKCPRCYSEMQSINRKWGKSTYSTSYCHKCGYLFSNDCRVSFEYNPARIWSCLFWRTDGCFNTQFTAPYYTELDAKVACGLSFQYLKSHRSLLAIRAVCAGTPEYNGW